MPFKHEVSPLSGFEDIILGPKTELQSCPPASTTPRPPPGPASSHSTFKVKQDPSVKKRSGTVSSDLLTEHLTPAHSTRVEESSTASSPDACIQSGFGSPQNLGTPLIRCDGCPRWYHLGCARVPVDDPRVSDPGVEFICDTCVELRSIPRKPGLHLFPIERGVCALRSCARPIRLAGEYFVERIIGHRFLRTAEKTDVIFEEFLVKWEDYPPELATWKRQDQIGALFTKYLREFETTAQYERPSKHSGSVVYLQEAIDAGWF